MKQICRLDKTNKRPYCLRKACSYKADGTCPGPVTAVKDYYGLHNCPGDPDPERRLDSARLVAVPCPHLVSNLLPHPLPRPVRIGGQPDSFLLCKEGTEETLNKNGRYGRRPYLPFLI